MSQRERRSSPAPSSSVPAVQANDPGEQHEQRCDKYPPRGRRRRQDARQLQALPGDGEHQKSNPERNGDVNWAPRQPQQIPQQPGGSTERKRQCEQLALAAEKSDRDGGHYRAARHDKNGQRSEIAPPPRQRHSALEADHRPKES
jgi:hypothetical protein